MIRVSPDIANSITKFGGAMPHRAQYELSLGPVIPATAKNRRRLNHDDFLLKIIRQEMVAKLIPE